MLNRCRNSDRKQRGAFTLVEMLVAIGITLVLASLIVAFTPSFLNAERTARGADLLQRWLLVAKQRARRDGIPRGVRLVVDPNSPSGTPVVRALQYIEQPDNYIKGTVTAASGTMTATISADVSEGFGPTQPTLWSVQPGDYLDVNDPTHNYLITAVVPPAMAGAPSTLTVLSSFTASVTGIQTKVIRAPRPSQGEGLLELPQDVVIDVTNSRPTDFATNSDILFLPGGKSSSNGLTTSTAVGVRRPGLTSNKIILWVRDASPATAAQETTGQQTLITIYTRTGFIAAHPVDTTSGGDPYSYTKDGRSSGS
jgi:type II secretory pathway pseudopilin PulG